jgi:hypothetical protein
MYMEVGRMVVLNENPYTGNGTVRILHVTRWNNTQQTSQMNYINDGEDLGDLDVGTRY